VTLGGPAAISAGWFWGWGCAGDGLRLCYAAGAAEVSSWSLVLRMVVGSEKEGEMPVSFLCVCTSLLTPSDGFSSTAVLGLRDVRVRGSCLRHRAALCLFSLLQPV
jgi:hypothetical protein